ncbi:lectin 2 [Crepidotus variabilis]|uniref:Lectin 2 n=1 Tax=Crepidotus variabilis TaxID=179855 RepID=A0A9P6E4D4_9AGAR|nr:lectin 2 [Crepidotus variabilis]
MRPEDAPKRESPTISSILSQRRKSMQTAISQDHPIPTATPGIADIVGFGIDGVRVMRNTLGAEVVNAIEDFGFRAGGWRTDRHVRLLGDTTGDGNAEIVGFGDDGVYVSRNLGNSTFSSPPTKVIGSFGYNQEAGGWRINKHPRLLADLRNTGRCDLIGFGDDGVSVSFNQGNGVFSPIQLLIPQFGHDCGGWRTEKHLRFLGDVMGNGFLDIVGFGDTHVHVTQNNGDQTFGPSQAMLNAFCYNAGGWRIEEHPRMMADLTGDGKLDIVGFAHAGVNVSFNNGNGGFMDPKIVVTSFGVGAGWHVDKHPRFVADLTGDRRGDIIGFGNEGVYVSYNNGDGTFQAPELVLQDFGVVQGWSTRKHMRFIVDLTGSGCADVLGFGESAVWAAFNDGKGRFGPVKKVTDSFAYGGGEWSLDITQRYVVNLGRRS